MRARALFLGIVLTLGGCRSSSPQRQPDAGPAVPTAASTGGRARLLDIENRRVTAGVTDNDIAHPDPAMRRLAVRAAARTGHPTLIPLLLKALADEDQEVVAWSAYGLGFLCRADGVSGTDVLRALVTRAANLPPREGDIALNAPFALSRAVGHCASEESEKVLTAWLGGPPRRASLAAIALGDVASRRKALMAGTQKALIAAATSKDGGTAIAEALFAFGRFEHPLDELNDDLLAAATSALDRPGAERIFAIRALSHVEKGAAPVLERVLTKADRFSVPERAEAARGLGRLGEPGQQALYRALPLLLRVDGSPSIGLSTAATFPPLLVALEAMHAPLRAPFPETALYQVAGLAIAEDLSTHLARRVVQLRCAAASLLVSGSFEDAVLKQCDRDPQGEIGERAELDVLGRRPFDARRLQRFRQLVASPHRRTREAAIDLLAAHPEVEETASIVAAALTAKEAGIVATAAEFIAAHPQRVAADPRAREAALHDGGAHAEAGPATPEVMTKLKEAFERRFAPDDIETQSALMEAAGATRLEAVAPAMEAFCRDANPTLRDHAARALSLLKGGPKPSCVAPDAAKEAARELASLSNDHHVKVAVVADTGKFEIDLDPTDAPVTVARIAALAESGFYNGIVVHRVVPGFVAQFGDPGGDGFGGPGLPPLRCETTPRPFEPFDVGVALSGRDTGSSQLFVTLSRTPHLDQEYAWIGHATGDWNAVAQGDVIREMRVLR